MLQQQKPTDYVIATGESHSVEDFLEKAFEYVGIDNWKKHVEISEKLIRPQDIDNLIGDSSKAKRELNWKPEISIEKGVRELAKRINYWKDAPVWTPKKIKKATKVWFKLLKKK